MASFYPSEGDMLCTAYMLNQNFASYPSSQLDSNKEFTDQPSVSFSHINRDEMVFMSPINIQEGMQQIERRSHVTPHYSDTHHVYPKESMHCSGSGPLPRYLSLSLGSQEPSLLQLHPDLNSSFCSALNSDVQSELQLSQDNNLKNVQYLSFDLGGHSQKSFTPKDERFSTPGQESTFCSSKYLKAAQDLLTELVSVHRAALKLSGESRNFNDASAAMEVKRDMSTHDLQKPNNELSPTERNDLQNKITKLMDLLDEVNRRYRKYVHQMQAVVSSFEMVVGCGSAKPYNSLARRTISRQFGALRGSIKKQIRAIQNSLGEQDTNPHAIGALSRVWYDQRQKAIQHFGIMRQPWRPQRGLPETAVSVLRAWLFEHFLHPYPKDSEKLVLARQTGLTRSQVANWFINARVRLWKPMIEKMYKEEFGDTETEFKAEDIAATFDDNLMSGAESNRQAQSNESELDFISISQSTLDNGGIEGKRVKFGFSMDNV